MNKNYPYRGRLKRGYCSRKRDEKDATKTRFYFSTFSDKDKKIYYCYLFSRNDTQMRTLFMEHQFLWTIIQLIDVFESLPYFTLPVEIVFVFF